MNLWWGGIKIWWGEGSLLRGLSLVRGETTLMHILKMNIPKNIYE